MKKSGTSNKHKVAKKSAAKSMGAAFKSSRKLIKNYNKAVKARAKK